jgi:hypothetical protein
VGFTSPVFLEYFNELEVPLPLGHLIISGYVRNISNHENIMVSETSPPLLDFLYLIMPLFPNKGVDNNGCGFIFRAKFGCLI